MKEILFASGGIPLDGNDFKTWNDNVYQAIQLNYLGQGDFVISGCNLSGTQASANISEGLVFIANKVRYFSAKTGVNMTAPVYYGISDVDSQPRVFRETLSTNNTLRDFGLGSAVGSAPVGGWVLFTWGVGASRRLYTNINDVTTPTYQEAATSSNIALAGATGVFANITGLQLTIATPGLYEITSIVTGFVQDSLSGGGVLIDTQLYNTTDAVAIANSRCGIAGCQLGTVIGYSTGTMTNIINVTKTIQYNVQARRTFTNTPQLSQINNGGSVSKLIAKRIG